MFSRFKDMDRSDVSNPESGEETSGRHSAKRAILDAAIADMEATGEASVRITKVLEEAGAANGSLYHHFGSREGLIQAAIAERFLGAVSQGLETFAARLAEVASTAELFEFFRETLVRYGTEAVRTQRERRLTTLAAALPRPELLDRIVADQARYFDGAAAALEGLRDRGIIRADLDVRSFAAWFLGLSMSRLLSEIDPVCDPDDAWSEYTYQSLVAILTPEPEPEPEPDPDPEP